MTKKFFILLSSILIFSFLQMDCKDDPPVIPPTSQEDTIITFEKVLADGEQPAVSPDGSKIVFVRDGDIWVMDTSGANAKLLSGGPETDITPRWKPDGSSIGFIRIPIGQYNKGRIMSVPSGGGGATQIVHDYYAADSLVTSASGIHYPIWDWSPNGDFVAFLEVNGFKTYLKAINLYTNEMKVSRELFDYQSAKVPNGSSFAWSQNSDEMVFNEQRSNGLVQLVLFNIQSQQSIVDTTYDLSKSICRQPGSDIYAFIKILGRIIVTSIKDTTYTEYEMYGSGGLKWSPDGKNMLIEYQGGVSGPFEYRYSRIAIFNFEKRKQYLLTTKGDIGRFIYFYEWGKMADEVYFERYKTINKVTFQFTN
jgi:Tol biopolymer transport system component